MNKQSSQQLRGPSLVLTMNGGSSSIKFALFEAEDSLRRILEQNPGQHIFSRRNLEVLQSPRET
jgi:acetate kinase